MVDQRSRVGYPWLRRGRRGVGQAGVAGGSRLGQVWSGSGEGKVDGVAVGARSTGDGVAVLLGGQCRRCRETVVISQ